MIRTQVYLTSGERIILREIAKKVGNSLSFVLRVAIDNMIEDREDFENICIKLAKAESIKRNK